MNPLLYVAFVRARYRLALAIAVYVLYGVSLHPRRRAIRARTDPR